MAEAHEAVAFSFNVTEDGVDINVNKEALNVLYYASKRSFKRRLALFKNTLKNRIYPIQLSSWPIFTLVICIAIHIGYDFSQYGMAALEDFSFKTLNIRTYTRLVAIILFSLIMWFVGILLVRYTLWFLFSYMEWMFEPRGTMTLKTRIWLGLIKLLSSKENRLYGYQSSLPRLPVPRIDKTINRYLLSVRPLLDDEEYSKMVQLAHEFRNTIANKLQLFLYLKSFVTSNYISDWWEDYVYLHTRTPIIVNSNFYCIDLIPNDPNDLQSAKAANFIYLTLQHRKSIDKETLKPIFINNSVPLCSSQYERQFNTTRIPGELKDSLVHYRESSHIVVMHNGRYYRVIIKTKSGILRPVDIERSLIYILNDKSEASEGEKKLAALTAGERKPWAEARKKFFSQGKNKASLDIIDKAAFVVSLDDVPYSYDEDKADDFCRAGLSGNCMNRWFDKSFTLFFGTNGMAGVNVEHAWGDGPITAHLWEYVSTINYLRRINSDGFVGYTRDNHCVGTADESNPLPFRLQFQINDQCLEVINNSLECARTLADNVDIHLRPHSAFGKGLMKKMKVSPDAFIQLALQLAQFRDQKRFCLTYEASMTRLFRDGRTETVRSCTVESCDFVRSMEDTSITKEELVKKFQIAVDKHQDMYRYALTGCGVDRHLFALYVVSRYLHKPSRFLDKVLGEPWRLSTSQTPHNQIPGLINFDKYQDAVCPGGGFGPVSDDGYGVSYIIAGENNIFFHVSSKISCPNTNSKRFANEICRALADLRELLDPTKKSSIKTNGTTNSTIDTANNSNNHKSNPDISQ